MDLAKKIARRFQKAAENPAELADEWLSVLEKRGKDLVRSQMKRYSKSDIQKVERQVESLIRSLGTWDAAEDLLFLTGEVTGNYP